MKENENEIKMKMDVQVYLGPKVNMLNGGIGQKYEVVVSPVPPDHIRIVRLIKNIIKDALE